jgi:subtilisin family serine protease
MKRLILAPLFALLLATTLTATSWAGRLSPGLERLADTMGGTEEIKVMVFVEDAAAPDVAAMDRRLRTEKATMAVRHREVIESLRDSAARSQAPVIQSLEANKAAGAVLGYTAHWLVNGIVVRTLVEHLDELAAIPGVDVIEPDMVFSLTEPVDSYEKGSLSRGGLGILPGIAAVQADRVWNELGIDGTGSLIGGLDTGVDGTHPALSARFRANATGADISECWRDSAGLGHATPTDTNSHGTHTMGTMCGVTAVDSIGIAPGALWIADNTINQGAGSAFDNDVLAALAWFSDPDGNPLTLDDVPDVVQNSWGVNEGFTGYVDCDSRWWAAIDNCEAAGVVLTWSAGNEGSGAGTLRSPADRCETPYNCFSVGSTIATPPYTISSFSSRGPSTCTVAPFPIKPEISAPGSDIVSSVPGGGFGTKSGTSMAGPHVAGVVALMRAANPDLDVQTIKQVLMDTATDLGTAGEDNTYGHGFLNAYDAVLAVIDGYGSIEGTITEATTTDPIQGATVSVVGDPRTATSDASGFYKLILPADSYTLNYSAFGYVDDSQGVVVVEDAISSGDIALAQAPTGTLSGVVTDFNSNLVENATIRVLDTPLSPVLSLVDGTYSIDVPTGTSYDVRASYPGLGPDTETVNMTGNVTQDFQLSELTYEDFESGDFSLLPWSVSGNAPWFIDTTNPYEGTYSARSGVISHNQVSTMELDVYLRDPGDVEFAYRVSSEATYDFLRFAIDGGELASWSGTVGWATASFPVTAGPHVLRWQYTKDISVSSGSDAAWVDLVTLPPLQFPDIAVDSSPVNETMPPDGSTDRIVTISNVGDGPLSFQAVVSNNIVILKDAAPSGMRETILLEKGEADPRIGESPLTGTGGPDGGGYSWIDSDEANGPDYDWVEISGVGTPIGLTDDSNQGPFALGFTFPFEGADYTSVRVCSNGFLTFTGTTSPYTNDPIPTSSVPNALLAVFWDDLNPADGGTVYYYADGANDRFIVEWNAVPHYQSGGGGAPQTFQAILNSDGTIDYQYKTVTGANEATVGIENAAGDDGLEVVFNGAYLHDGLAVRFLRTEPFVEVSPTSGSVPAKDSVDLTVSFDATGLLEDYYEALLTLTSNDPDESLIEIPLGLTVTLGATGAPVVVAPSRFALGRATPNPFGTQTVIRFEIPRAGVHADLTVYDVTGRRVKTLVSGPQTAGYHLVVWDGKDGGGHRVAAGTYFYRLRAGEFDQSHRMVRLR